MKTAVIQILMERGYAVDRKDDENLTAGYREKISSPLDWLLHWRFGTGRSRVEAMVTPASEQSSRLRLNVLYEGQDGYSPGGKIHRLRSLRPPSINCD